jgi:hypothetical protein
MYMIIYSCFLYFVISIFPVPNTDTKIHEYAYIEQAVAKPGIYVSGGRTEVMMILYYVLYFCDMLCILLRILAQNYIIKTYQDANEVFCNPIGVQRKVHLSNSTYMCQD